MDKIRRDFVGNEINIGDEVSYCWTGQVSFDRGRVVGFTPKTVQIADETEYEKFLKGEDFTYCTNKIDNNVIVICYMDPEVFRKALTPV